MALVVNTNLASLNAQRQLSSTTNEMATAMERLSSGQRINSASDDAAGLAISSRMTSQVKGLTMAVRNANDGISIVQTAEGALDEVDSMLQRMRELAVQASSGSNSDADLASLDSEVDQLLDEIDRISTTTRFNNMNILDGSYNIDIQVGDQADQQMSIAIADMSADAMGESPDGLAAAATAAAASVSGATDVGAYVGRSFNVTSAQGSATVDIPDSQLSEATAASVSGTFAGEDVGPATSRVISTIAMEANTVDMTSAASRVFDIRVQDSAVTTIDFTDALVSQLGYNSVAQLEDTTNFHGDFVKQNDLVTAMQAALDAELSGGHAVTVGVDEYGALTFTDSDGRADRISLREGIASDGTTGTFLANFVDSGLTSTVMTNILGQGTSATGVDFGSDDSLSAFKVKINGASSYTTVDFLDKLNDSSIVHDRDQVFGYELVNAIQAEMDEIFTGDDAVTVGISANGQLSFSVAGGNRTIDIAEATYIDTDLSATAATFVAELVDTSANAVFDNKANPNSLDLTSVNSKDLTDMYKAFQDDNFAINVRVNGGTATDIDLAFYLQDAVTDFDDPAGEEIAAALQAAFDDQFTGDDAITVSLTYDGKLNFDVAGGAEVLEIREADVNADGTYGTFASNFIDSSIATAATSFVMNENILGVTTYGDVAYGTMVEDAATAVTSLTDSLVTQPATASFEIAGGGGSRMTPFAVDDFNSPNASGVSEDGTATAGMTIDASNNTLSISLDDATAVDITIDTGEYATLEALAASIQFEIDASGQFEGEDALRVLVESYTNGTDATTELDGAVKRLVLASDEGKKIELSGIATTDTSVNGFAVFGAELDTSVADTTLFQELGVSPDQTNYRTNDRIDGGVDTTAASGIVNLQVQINGNTLSYDLALEQDVTTSYADFTADLATKANAAFASDNISFTAANTGSQFTLTMDTAGESTFSLSGEIIDAALGGTLTGSGSDAGVTSLNDVVSEVNADLASIGVTAALNDGEWTFTDTSGTVGSASSISVSGSDLSQLGMSAVNATGVDTTATGAVLSSVSVSSTDNATAALTSIDNAIEYINAQRADLGAVENRLNHTVNNLSNVIENTSASRSRIMDADYAVEAANLAKTQVMQQAGTAMLAQANAQAQIVLSLLG